MWFQITFRPADISFTCALHLLTVQVIVYFDVPLFWQCNHVCMDQLKSENTVGLVIFEDLNFVVWQAKKIS